MCEPFPLLLPPSPLPTSSLFWPSPAFFGHVKPIQLIPANYSILQPIQVLYILFTPHPAYSIQIQPITAYSCLIHRIHPIPVSSSLFYPTTAFSSPFQSIPAYSSQFQHGWSRAELSMSKVLFTVRHLGLHGGPWTVDREQSISLCGTPPNF